MAAIFANGSGRNEKFYRGPPIDASYQVLVHLAKRFQRRRFFRNQPIRNKNCLWWPWLLTDRDEMSNCKQRTFHRCFLPSFDSFGQTVSEEKNLKNQPIRNKNCLWRLCFLTDRDGMSNLYRGPSIDASYQVSDHLDKWFQRRRFLEINQSETRIACGGHVCQWIGTKWALFIEDSSGTVALMQFFWYLRTIGLRISPYKKLSKVHSENPAHLSCKLLSRKKGPRTIKHICIVSLDIYLHSSILTYLLIFISSSLL
jgi:hypothetical protein